MRERTFASVLDTLIWCSSRETPFTVHDLARGTGVHKRTAYRHLLALEGCGAIEQGPEQRATNPDTGGRWAGTWRCRLRLTWKKR